MRLVIIVLLVSLLGSGSVAATQKGIGVEYMSEEEVGISLKIATGAHSATACGITWSFDGPTTLSFHIDALVYASQSRYYGIGLGASYTETEDVGKITNPILRFPVGFEKNIQTAPIAFFGELTPVLELDPVSKVNVRFMVGVRYLFL